MKYSNIIYVAATSLLMFGCTNENDYRGDADDGQPVTFTVQTEASVEETRSGVTNLEAIPLEGDGVQLWLQPSVTSRKCDVTRGTQINSVTALDSFGVSAYKHGAIPSGKTLNEYLADNHKTPDYFYKLKATKVPTTEKFKLETDYYWPANDEILSFFAYAPYGDPNVAPVASSVEGPQVINFTVNTNVKKQADFMTAQASSTAHTNANQTPSVQLNFQHHLAAVRFIVGQQFLAGWVKKITLKGVYTRGAYTIGDGWTLNPSDKGNFSISYSMDKHVDGTEGEAITASDETFLMIPETFAASDTASIEVLYHDGHKDYPVSAPLKNTSWEAGKTITYEITSNSLTTLKISSITFDAIPSAASGMPNAAKGWRVNDKVGMYVVAADGVTLKHRNIPVTYDGTNWNIDHTTSAGTIYRLPGETFYFYYPYKNNDNGQPSGYPEECPSAGASAESFFEGVIDGFNVHTDQHELDDFIDSDLMVAKATDTGYASTIEATMSRQVGISVLTLDSKEIPYTITYTNNGAGQPSSTKYTITASSNFLEKVPIKNTGNTYYFFTKVGGTTTFNSKAGETYYWSAALNYNPGKNAVQSQTAHTTVEWDWTFVQAIYNYTYTDWPYEFTAPVGGTYTLECTGYGTSSAKGGYIKGTKDLAANAKLIVYVGGLIASGYYFNLNGSSDIRTTYSYYNHSYNGNSKYFYGPYWNGGSGTYQWDEKGSNLNYASDPDCCINQSMGITLSNVQKVASHMSATSVIDASQILNQSNHAVEFRFYNNATYPVTTSSVVSVRDSRLISAGGVGNGNGVWNNTAQVSSTTGTNNGNGSVTISISRK